MPRCYTADGTELAYHLRGEGAPLVWLAGRPGACLRLPAIGRLQVDDPIRVRDDQSSPWFAAAAALERDADTDEDQKAIAPFFCGRGDTAARAHWAGRIADE
jgi:hypothetical protein